VILFASLLLLFRYTKNSPIGSWDYKVKTPSREFHGIMNIKEHQSKYSGYFISELSDTLRLIILQLADQQLSTDFIIGTINYHLTGTFSEDVFTGEVSVGAAVYGEDIKANQFFDGRSGEFKYSETI
jgi:hypothetical protein